MPPINRPNDDSWIEYRRLVLAELERLDSAIDKLVNASTIYEKQFLEKLQTLKDSLEEHHRNTLSVIKKELENKEKHDIEILQSQTNDLKELYHKVITEVKVIKAKAAFLGFLSGLGIAIIGLIAKIIWGK